MLRLQPTLRPLQKLALHHRAAATKAPAPAWLQTHQAFPQAGAHMPANQPARKRRIIHRSRQRGWLELDILLGGWAAKHVPSLGSDADLAVVEDLLVADTPDVLRWVLGHSDPPPRFDTHVMKSLREYASGGGAAAL